ncbi:uncharacterized protein BX663DRAFT_545040 [Cokeromyces recurvatus]|uniref:uncharacterized protein n=1 Tax=Cokeromyces recurvatus TaxID=90255 RepID=UPI00221FCC9B|nr:uncharacterized protein BX663DRAFT_545040 [Cokeromyces recurvatus]KAI7900322.1 hypothetical protein BX663DRAFT_545040 [Cokeromyces recurvatus]
MAKGNAKNEKHKKKERITRRQKRELEKSLSSNDPEDLDAQLKQLGLCTKNITGDGNCLFRSLSDQYYGHDGNHKAIRQEICQYLRENEELYKFFVEDDQSFEHHVECMSQDATFGGNMELAAFAKLKKTDIKVYQPGLIYVINGVDEEEDDDEEERQILHIAYHSWEHYSSIRNIDGPFSGPPEIHVTENKVQNDEQRDETTEDQENEEEEELNSKEKVVKNACPDANIRKIRRLLIKYKGNPDKVIDALYEEKEEKIGSKENEEGYDIHENKKESEKEQDNEIVEEDKNITIIEDKELSPSNTIVKKPSAAERKREAKKRQKEKKLQKEREKAARKAKYKQEKNTDNDIATKAIAQSMKEMYI